jgi:hemerythrin-like domain-containing protein
MPPAASAYADTTSMYGVHTVFRREFGLLPDLVQSVAAGDEARAKIVADHAGLMTATLSHHHAAEDEVLWPLLLARAPREVDPVVRLAEGHHQRMETLLHRLAAPLAAWVNDAPAGARDTLAATLRELDVVLFEHMRLEEQLVLPVVERHVFTAEWEALEQRSVAGIAPENIVLIFGMAMYESGEEIVPPPLRAEVVPAAPAVYASYAERVHGTPTPPRAADVVFGTPDIGVRACSARLK